VTRPNSPPLPVVAVAPDSLDSLAGQPPDCLAMPVPDCLVVAVVPDRLATAIVPDYLVAPAGLS
jgi:hypothetical protein